MQVDAERGVGKPPPQQNAATTPAFLGPACSSHRPNTAADDPRKTKNRVNIHPAC